MRHIWSTYGAWLRAPHPKLALRYIIATRTTGYSDLAMENSAHTYYFAMTRLCYYYLPRAVQSQLKQFKKV